LKSPRPGKRLQVLEQVILASISASYRVTPSSFPSIRVGLIPIHKTQNKSKADPEKAHAFVGSFPVSPFHSIFIDFGLSVSAYCRISRYPWQELIGIHHIFQVARPWTENPLANLKCF